MSDDLFAKLAAPFDPASIHWRVGSTTQDKKRGLALAYLDARDVMERLDEVVGPAGWQDRYEVHGPRTVCYLSVRIGEEWITKADGAGDTDVEAEKGSISDSFKRAAVKWGIGRYLYDVEAPWVELEPAGRSYRIKPSELKRLAAVLSGGKVERADNREDDTAARATMNQMIEEMRQCTTLKSLDALKVSDSFIGRFRALPDPLRNAVSVAGTAFKAELTKHEAVKELGGETLMAG